MFSPNLFQKAYSNVSLNKQAIVNSSLLPNFVTGFIVDNPDLKEVKSKLVFIAANSIVEAVDSVHIMSELSALGASKPEEFLQQLTNYIQTNQPDVEPTAHSEKNPNVVNPIRTMASDMDSAKEGGDTHTSSQSDILGDPTKQGTDRWELS